MTYRSVWTNRTFVPLTLMAFCVTAFVLMTNLQAELGSSVKDNTPLLMRAKLASSKRVLEGLVTDDAALIQRAATDMLNMSHANRWPQAQDKVYEHFSESFRRHCKKLITQATKGELDSAEYTYLALTANCMDCHNYVRGRFRIERDPKNADGPVKLIPTEWEGQSKAKKIPTGGET